MRGTGILALTLLYDAAGLVLFWYWDNFVAREAAKDLGVLSTSSIKDGGKPTTTTFGKGSVSKLQDETSKTVLAC